MFEAAQDSTINFNCLQETFLKMRYIYISWQAALGTNKLSVPCSLLLQSLFIVTFHLLLALCTFHLRVTRQSVLTVFSSVRLQRQGSISGDHLYFTICVKYFGFKWLKNWACQVQLGLGKKSLY